MRTSKDIQKEIDCISAKMNNAFVYNLSGEEYAELIENKLKLMHELFMKIREENNKS